MEWPPLPPASGSPIGLLVDEAGALRLRGEQVDQLREIDVGLAARNGEIDSRLRAMDRPAVAAAPSGGGRRGRHGGGGPGGGGPGGGGFGGGGPGGGHGGSGMGGPGGGGPGSGGPGSGGPGGGVGGRRHPPGASKPGAPTGNASQLQEERAANVREAVARAFAVLDPDQRVAAEKLLDDRGAAPGVVNPAGPGARGSDAPVERDR